MKKILILLLLTCISAIGYSQSIQTPLFTSGFLSPVNISNCGDSRLFIVERKGKIYIVDSLGVKNPTPFLDIDSIVNDGNDERGLLGLAFSPSYATDGYLFVYYIDNSGNSQIARYSRLNTNQANASSKQIVLSVVQPGFANHKGGNMKFGPDGYLYCGFGDGGSGGDPNNYSQNMQNMLGKLIRIDVSSLPYTIPSSNPYVGTAPLDEIWASGLRNPWKWSFDKLNGNIWIADVGQGAWEEIDFQPATSTGGHNYGWRCYEGNAAYNTSGCLPASNYIFPVYAYPHSGANSGCSVTGGYVYRGIKYNSLFGQYLFSDYCTGNIWGLSSNYTFTNYGNFSSGLSSFGENVYGEMFFVNVNNGNLYKITTTECSPVAYITNSDTTFACNGPAVLKALYNPELTYQWKKNGVNINGATSYSYSTSNNGSYSVVVTNSNNCSNTSVSKVVKNNKPQAPIYGDTTFCTGGSAAIHTDVVSGLSYQWQKYNNNISGANADTYYATTEGTYRVIVTNTLGCTKASNGKKITGPPNTGTILNGSTSQCIGDSVEIEAKIAGNTYQWIRNGVDIAGATNQNYFITINGNYKVRVTNALGCSKTGFSKQITFFACKNENISYEVCSYILYSTEGKIVKYGNINSYNKFDKNIFKDFFKGLYIIKYFDKNKVLIKIDKIVL